MRPIVVTGANKGIGKAIVERLLTEYTDTMVFLGSRDLKRGQEAVQSILSRHPSILSSRIQVLELNVASDASVQAAATQLANDLHGMPLYGIVNNAGMWSDDYTETLNTNYFGVRRVNDALIPLLQRPGGRMVHVSSAAGPSFVSSLAKSSPLYDQLSHPWKIAGGIQGLDALAKGLPWHEYDRFAIYSATKALLNAYTVLHGKSTPDIVIHACTPGWIDTDLTQGHGATKPPSEGAIPPCWLLMSEEVLQFPNGRYFGSDCVRSPLHEYRGPGDPPYESNEDLVDLSLECPSNMSHKE